MGPFWPTTVNPSLVISVPSALRSNCPFRVYRMPCGVSTSKNPALSSAKSSSRPVVASCPLRMSKRAGPGATSTALCRARVKSGRSAATVVTRSDL